MEDLSLHILDIAENSITAGSKNIEISLWESSETDSIVLTIKDDGKGMTNMELENATDPFVTTKKSKRVGLGLPLLEQAAIRAGGTLTITSERGNGLELRATFKQSHIDRQPLGDMNITLLTLISSYPSVNFGYKHMKDKNEFYFNTKEIKSQLNGIEINNPEVLKVIRELLIKETALE